MKLNGFHLHIILVVAMICIVVYVFYIARDIISIDRELKALGARVEHLATMKQVPPAQQQVQRSLPPTIQQPHQGARQPQMPTVLNPSLTMQMNVPTKLGPGPNGSLQQPMNVAAVPLPVFDNEDASDSETETDTDIESEDIEEIVVNDKADSNQPPIHSVKDDDGTLEEIKQMLEPVVEEITSDDIKSANKTNIDYAKLTWNEIKDLCRERGIAIKGFNKEQLLVKLKQA